jgi:phage FluMu protein Com
MTADFLDIRCPHCNRLLLQVSGLALIRVKCPKCRTVAQWPVCVAEVVPEGAASLRVGWGGVESGVEGVR